MLLTSIYIFCADLHCTLIGDHMLVTEEQGLNIMVKGSGCTSLAAVKEAIDALHQEVLSLKEEVVSIKKEVLCVKDLLKLCPPVFAREQHNQVPNVVCQPTHLAKDDDNDKRSSSHGDGKVDLPVPQAT